MTYIEWGEPSFFSLWKQINHLCHSGKIGNICLSPEYWKEACLLGSLLPVYCLWRILSCWKFSITLDRPLCQQSYFTGIPACWIDALCLGLGSLPFFKAIIPSSWEIMTSSMDLSLTSIRTFDSQAFYTKLFDWFSPLRILVIIDSLFLYNIIKLSQRLRVPDQSLY